MSDPNPKRERCARCGQVAVGSAAINGQRYCHDSTAGMTDEEFWDVVYGRREVPPTCYELSARR